MVISYHEGKVNILASVSNVHPSEKTASQSVEGKVPRPQQIPHADVLHPRVQLYRPAALRFVSSYYVQKTSAEHHHIAFHCISCHLGLRGPEVHPAVMIFGVCQVQTREVAVGSEFVFGSDFVAIFRDDLRVILDGLDDVGKSMELGKILLGNFFELFLVLINRFCLGLSLLLRRFLLSTLSISLNIDQNFIRITDEGH